MIKSFIHKGLEDFYYEGATKGIQAKHAARQMYILDLLNSAGTVGDMNYSGSGLHPLKVSVKGSGP